MAFSGQAVTHLPHAWQSSGLSMVACLFPCTLARKRERRGSSARWVGLSLMMVNRSYGHTRTQSAFPSHRLRSI
jgi:hypothetical protein